jgi:hypothetical protein
MSAIGGHDVVVERCLLRDEGIVLLVEAASPMETSLSE